MVWALKPTLIVQDGVQDGAVLQSWILARWSKLAMQSYGPNDCRNRLTPVPMQNELSSRIASIDAREVVTS
jgi:hypothetical protein